MHGEFRPQPGGHIQIVGLAVPGGHGRVTISTTMELAIPGRLFDRDAKWAELTSFATDRALGATLAIVYGRRRQGKTLLLELLSELTAGLMFTGLK